MKVKCAILENTPNFIYYVKFMIHVHVYMGQTATRCYTDTSTYYVKYINWYGQEKPNAQQIVTLTTWFLYPSPTILTPITPFCQGY